MGKHAALEIRADLALDEASHGSTRGSGAREERLHILADDAMEERLLGLMAFVTNRDGFAGTGLEPNLLRNRYAGCGVEDSGGSRDIWNSRFGSASANRDRSSTGRS